MTELVNGMGLKPPKLLGGIEIVLLCMLCVHGLVV